MLKQNTSQTFDKKTITHGNDWSSSIKQNTGNTFCQRF